MDIKVIVPSNTVVFVDDNGVPQYVKPLLSTERLVEVGKFNDFVKPFHNGTEWVESATPEEIAIARPKPKPVVNELEAIKEVLDLLLMGGL